MIGRLLVGFALVASAGCGSSTDLSTVAYTVSIAYCDGNFDGLATAVAVGPTTLASAGHPFDSHANLIVEDADGATYEATLIHLDPEKDLALIELRHAVADFLPLADPETGSPVELATFRDGQFSLRTGTIVRKLDIQLDGTGDRRGLELRAGIEPGDSGAGVVIDGSLVGVVFGADPVDPNHGWAVSSEEVAEALKLVADGNAHTPEQPCAGRENDQTS